MRKRVTKTFCIFINAILTTIFGISIGWLLKYGIALEFCKKFRWTLMFSVLIPLEI